MAAKHYMQIRSGLALEAKGATKLVHAQSYPGLPTMYEMDPR
jgi:hypothetical protein